MLSFIKDSFQEVRTKITWPSYAEVQRHTITVALFAIVFSLLLWGMDFLFNKSLAFYLEVVGS